MLNQNIDLENTSLVEAISLKEREYGSLLKYNPKAKKEKFYSSQDRLIAELKSVIEYMKILVSEHLKSYLGIIDKLNEDNIAIQDKVMLLGQDSDYFVRRPNRYLFMALKAAQHSNQTAYVHAGVAHVIKAYPHIGDANTILLAALDEEQDSNPYALLVCNKKI
jgi:hypothetical protein